MTATLERAPLRGKTVRSRSGSFSIRFDVRSAMVCAVLLVAALAVSTYAVSTGDFPIALPDLFQTLIGQGSRATNFIVLELRLPRVLLALLVGAALGISGAIMQSVSRNPLGSPDIIGFDAGAAAAALVAILLLGSGGGSFTVAAFAIVGGLLTAAAVYFLAYKRGVHGYRLVLVGIGVSAMLLSVRSFLIVRADLDEALRAQVWLVGSLNGRGWEQVGPVVAALVVLVPAVLVLSRAMRMMEMGSDAASSLGVSVQRNQLALVLLSVALAAVATAAAGPIAFVALAAPQLAQRLTRMPGLGIVSAGCMGALLLVASDVASQRALGWFTDSATQLPVGVSTAVVGGIYLVWLLSRDRRAKRAA